MCDPVSLTFAAGAVVETVGAYQGARAEKGAANYNADVALRNAGTDEERARDALMRGEQDVFKSRLNQAQVEGSQVASFAARGLDITQGSALNILMDTKYIGDLDAETLSTNAEREAKALRDSAGASRRQAQFLRGRANAISPGRAAFTSLLGSATKVAAANYKYGASPLRDLSGGIRYSGPT